MIMSVKDGRSCPDCGTPMEYHGHGIWICRRCGKAIAEDES
jgi:ribosomal protein L37AE/L43A